MEKDIKGLIQDFYSNDGIIRQKARFELVEIGKPVIGSLIGLQYVPEQQVRWEAIKTLSQIADPESIPILIRAFENSNIDVRWLAAEGLIEIGEKSIRPVLEQIEKHQDSVFTREGAHHVLKALGIKKIFFDDFEIVKMLEDFSKHPILAVTAYKILNGDEV